MLLVLNVHQPMFALHVLIPSFLMEAHVFRDAQVVNISATVFAQLVEMDVLHAPTQPLALHVFQDYTSLVMLTVLLHAQPHNTPITSLMHAHHVIQVARLVLDPRSANHAQLDTLSANNCV